MKAYEAALELRQISARYLGVILKSLEWGIQEPVCSEEPLAKTVDGIVSCENQILFFKHSIAELRAKDKYADVPPDLATYVRHMKNRVVQAEAMMAKLINREPMDNEMLGKYLELVQDLGPDALGSSWGNIVPVVS